MNICPIWSSEAWGDIIYRLQLNCAFAETLYRSIPVYDMTENIRAVTNWPKLVARLNKNFISFLSFESVERNLSKEMIATSAHTVPMNLFSTNQTFLLPASASLSISPEGLTFVLGIKERFELWGILSWTTRMPKMTSSRNGEEFVKYIPYKYRSAKKPQGWAGPELNCP